MIRIIDKKECCGCGACVQRCPPKCIHLLEDSEGFLYPEVDEKSCINCGLCEKVCPLINQKDIIMPLSVLAVKNRNEEERMNSSSGGVFIALAKYVLEKGGVVFGAEFDEHWEVKHTYAADISGARAMMGSKYLQSRIETAYLDAERLLKADKYVLFSGTPCQIAGLHNFLHKDYTNLLTVDFLCHGVPSPGVWRKYLNEVCNRIVSKDISKISFRDKAYDGWKGYNLVIYKRILDSNCHSMYLSEMHRNNSFMRGFLSDIYLRPSCYKCRCKNGVSHSDITIADYWGINMLMPDFDDDKGVGLVLLNTLPGKDVFSRLDMDIRESTLEDARRFNGGFKENIIVHPQRDSFFRLIGEGKDVIGTIDKLLYVPINKRIVLKVGRLIGKLWNKVKK